MFKDFSQLLKHLMRQGCTRFFVKKLSPNDNSKNQVYLGGSFDALRRIPSGEFSREKTARGKVIIKAPVAWHWLGQTGEANLAPGTKLILYPQYPEVRLSGFLKGCSAPPGLMRGREKGRLLVMGVDLGSQSVVAGIYPAKDKVSRTCPFDELEATDSAMRQARVGAPFLQKPGARFSPERKQQFPGRIPDDVVRRGWVDSMRIGKDGLQPYRAQNGVGYTLEALLGISPNGYSAPDYLGWELKAFTVNSFARDPAPSKAISLMTPEPDGGVYVNDGLGEFLRRWGYWKDGKHRFTGRYRVGEISSKNEMKLTCPGVGSIDHLKGSIKLVDKEGVVAASWSLTKLLDHWKRKHNQAAYLMAKKRNRGERIQYRYNSEVFLGEGANKSNFFESIRKGRVYYDPAPWIKEDGKFKKRSQFRIAFKDLASMYEIFQKVDILD